MKVNHILKMKCSFEVKVEEEILKLFFWLNIVNLEILTREKHFNYKVP